MIKLQQQALDYGHSIRQIRGGIALLQQACSRMGVNNKAKLEEIQKHMELMAKDKFVSQKMIDQMTKDVLNGKSR